jgi:hypothetical protein
MALGEPGPDAPRFDDGAALDAPPAEAVPCAAIAVASDAPDAFAPPLDTPAVSAPGREALHPAANSGKATMHARCLRDPCTKFIASETRT